MKETKTNFLRLALDSNVLQFGEFTLKSGRKSPYFFNAGLFNTGRAIAQLGRHYADTIVSSNIEFDMLFGPAYKGITLASATASALSDKYDIDKPFAFNRKESKAHGEGGCVVGANLKGKVLIIDDVITAGTAVREAYELIISENASVAGLVISMDRQERGKSRNSAISELEQELSSPVISIANLEDLIFFIKEDEDLKSHLPDLIEYRSKYSSL